VILALDFDGVICDSINECLLLANAAFYYNNKLLNMTEYPSVNSEFKERFKKLRYMVNNAAEYWFLLHCLKNNESLNSQFEFDSKKANYTNQMNEFEKDFYSLRKQVRTSNPDYWLSLHSIFPQFKSSWKNIRDLFDIYIVTMKDTKSVLDLLNYNNIDFPVNKILGYKGNNNKSASIMNIAGSNNVTTDDIYFVDDNIFQLMEVYRTGSSCFFALWGYCDPNTDKLPLDIVSINNLKELIQYTNN